MHSGQSIDARTQVPDGGSVNGVETEADRPVAHPKGIARGHHFPVWKMRGHTGGISLRRVEEGFKTHIERGDHGVALREAGWWVRAP